MILNPTPTPKPTPTPNPKIETVLSGNGDCNTTSCSNANRSGSFTGSSHYNKDESRWEGPNETRNGPSFTMNLSDVKFISLDYGIHLGGSTDAYDSIKITLNCGGVISSVSKGEHNSHDYSGTISVDVSKLSGTQTCSTTINFTGSGANNNYGYWNGASYNISRIYPTY